MGESSSISCILLQPYTHSSTSYIADRCCRQTHRKVTLRHGPAEETGEPSNKFDLATICLVNHESPEWVSRAMFREAYRVLRPGGVFTILDLDKNNLAILLENPFVAAVYKQVGGRRDRGGEKWGGGQTATARIASRSSLLGCFGVSARCMTFAGLCCWWFSSKFVMFVCGGSSILFLGRFDPRTDDVCSCGGRLYADSPLRCSSAYGRKM